MVRYPDVFCVFICRMGLGGKPSSDLGRRVCQPGRAAWSMAAHLRRRRHDDPRVLYKLRGKPIREFIATILLCGCVEYFTSWLLELIHDGEKWWDYSGYFLNLHGRICAEGLLVFGLGGMAIVYFLAPLLDTVIRRFRSRVLMPICLVLLIIGCDQIYSCSHPNTGKGITDYESSETARLPGDTSSNDS